MSPLDLAQVFTKLSWGLIRVSYMQPLVKMELPHLWEMHFRPFIIIKKRVPNNGLGFPFFLEPAVGCTQTDSHTLCVCSNWPHPRAPGPFFIYSWAVPPSTRHRATVAFPDVLLHEDSVKSGRSGFKLNLCTPTLRDTHTHIQSQGWRALGPCTRTGRGMGTGWLAWPSNRDNKGLVGVSTGALRERVLLKLTGHHEDIASNLTWQCSHYKPSPTCWSAGTKGNSPTKNVKEPLERSPCPCALPTAYPKQKK